MADPNREVVGEKIAAADPNPDDPNVVDWPNSEPVWPVLAVPKPPKTGWDCPKADPPNTGADVGFVGEPLNIVAPPKRFVDVFTLSVAEAVVRDLLKSPKTFLAASTGLTTGLAEEASQRQIIVGHIGRWCSVWCYYNYMEVVL